MFLSDQALAQACSAALTPTCSAGGGGDSGGAGGAVATLGDGAGGALSAGVAAMGLPTELPAPLSTAFAGGGSEGLPAGAVGAVCAVGGGTGAAVTGGALVGWTAALLPASSAAGTAAPGFTDALEEVPISSRIIDSLDCVAWFDESSCNALSYAWLASLA